MARTNSWANTSPADHTQFKAQPGHVRSLKTDIEERLTDILYGFTTGGETVDFNGFKQIPFMAWGTPSTPSGTGSSASYILFGSASSGQVELFGVDSGGTVSQLTKAGSVCALGNGQAFRTGDLLFTTSTGSATGWSDVSATYEGKFIRIGTGTPLTAGGADTHTHDSGSLSASSHTHSVVPTRTVTSGSNTNFNVCQAAGETSSATETVCTGSTAAANNIPAYIEIRVLSKT